MAVLVHSSAMCGPLDAPLASQGWSLHAIKEHRLFCVTATLPASLGCQSDWTGTNSVRQHSRLHGGQLAGVGIR